MERQNTCILYHYPACLVNFMMPSGTSNNKKTPKQKGLKTPALIYSFNKIIYCLSGQKLGVFAYRGHSMWHQVKQLMASVVKVIQVIKTLFTTFLFTAGEPASLFLFHLVQKNIC